MPKKKIPKLLVMFDTNVLFTQVASDLVRHNVRNIIKENSNHPDLTIKWFLPEVVVEERKYQMLGKANELLPSMQKLEKLLGHQFGIREDTLELHVDNAIKDGIKECEFQIATIDPNEIDWKNLISRSVKREPPFEANEKEKGFRDSIIAHSFLQLLKKSPSTPNICRLALISDDRKLGEYVSELTVDSKNVRMLSSLDELENLINTLVSTITEEFAEELVQKASKLFFEKENNKTFYYKEGIGEKIREQFSKELSNTMIIGGIRSGGTWFISNPIFIKKEQRCIHWVTTVETEFEIYHYEQYDSGNTAWPPLPPQPGMPGLIPQPGMPGLIHQPGLIPQPGLPGLMHQPGLIPQPQLPTQPGALGQNLLSQKRVVDFKGKEKFEVHWSTNLSQAQNLTAPKLEKILYIGNNLGL